MNGKYIFGCLVTLYVYVFVADGLQSASLAELLNRGVGQSDPDSLDEYERLSGEVPPSVDDIETLKSDLTALAKLNNVENNDVYNPRVDSDEEEDPAVSKRPFCNGFTGCGRIGKRSSLLLEKLQLPNQVPVGVIAKRPFCNGFFGCGNPGKRLVFRNARIVNRNILNGRPRPINQKRFFCNPGAFGCSNQGKRSSYMPWIERLRARIPGLISDIK